MKHLFQCERCKTNYPSQSEAERCEAKHKAADEAERRAKEKQKALADSIKASEDNINKLIKEHFDRFGTLPTISFEGEHTSLFYGSVDSMPKSGWWLR